MVTENSARLITTLEARVNKFERDLAKANGTARREFGEIEKRGAQMANRLESTVASAGSGVNRGLGKMSAGFAAAMGTLKAGLAGFVVGAAGAFSLDGIQKSIADLAKLQDAVERTGASASFLQELAFAVEQSGGEAADAAAGMQKFAINVSKAAQGSGDMAKLFEANGVAITDATGKMKPIEEQLRVVADLIKNAESEQDKLNIATAAFGRSAGPAMVLALAGGRDGIAAFAKEAREAGIVIGDDMVKQAAKLDDQIAKTTRQMDSLGKQILLEAGPAIEAGLELGLAKLREFKQLLEDIRNVDLSNILKFLASRTGPGALYNALQSAAPSATPVATTYEPSRAGFTAGAAKPTIIPAGAGDDEDGEGAGSRKARQASPYAAAKRYSGLQEGRDDTKIRDLLRKGGGEFSGELKVWCADFVNAVLAEKGIEGTGSRSARSFLNYGEETTKPTEGDIVVLKRGKEDSGSGHVGFFQGYDEAGRVKVLGGNQSEGVNTQSYDSSRVLGFRKQPEAGDDTTGRLTAEKAARELATQTADKQAEAVKRVMEALGLEAAQIGKTAEQQQVLQELQTAGVNLNSKEGEAIRDKVAALHALKAIDDQRAATADDLKKREEEIKRGREELASIGSDATKGIISDLKAGVSAADAFNNALGRIVDRLLDMVVDDLFASLFKTGAASGTGGLLAGIGSLFGGGRERGGPVRKGVPYLVGEKRPELFVPGSSGRIVPRVPDVPGLKSGAGPMLRQNNTTKVTHNIKTSIDLTGANGDATIRRIAREESERGVQQGLSAYDRALPERINYMQQHER